MPLLEPGNLNSGYRRVGARRPGATEPNGQIIGDLWYDTSLSVLNVWNGTAWVEINSLTPSPRRAGSLQDNTNPVQGTNWTKLPMNASSVILDSAASGAIDLVNDTYVAQIPGLFHVVGACEVLLNNNPQRFILSARKNQLEDINEIRGSGFTLRGGTGGDAQHLHVCGYASLNTGDTLSLWLFNNGANNVQVISSAGWQTKFTVVRHGPRPS